MAFEQFTQTSNVAGPKDLELKKKELERDIELLGNQHFADDLAYRKIKKELKEIEERKAKVKDVKINLKKLEKKEQELNSTVSDL